MRRKAERLLIGCVCYGIYLLVGMGWQTEEICQVATVKGTVKNIALTFDDGPSIYTETLLDGLKKYGVKATFFVLGEQAKGRPEVVRRILDEGHLIGNHTYHHVEMTKLTTKKAMEEIQKTSQLLEGITGEKIQYVRPPFGMWSKRLEEKVGLIPVFWSVDPLDWNTKNVDEIVKKVVTEVKENDIILLHDCSESSVEAALQIVRILQERGYRFVTVEELIL